VLLTALLPDADALPAMLLLPTALRAALPLPLALPLEEGSSALPQALLLLLPVLRAGEGVLLPQRVGLPLELPLLHGLAVDLALTLLQALLLLLPQGDELPLLLPEAERDTEPHAQLLAEPLSVPLLLTLPLGRCVMLD